MMKKFHFQTLIERKNEKIKKLKQLNIPLQNFITRQTNPNTNSPSLVDLLTVLEITEWNQVFIDGNEKDDSKLINLFLDVVFENKELLRGAPNELVLKRLWATDKFNKIRGRQSLHL